MNLLKFILNFFLVIFTLPLMIVVYLFLLLHRINPVFVSERVGKDQKNFKMFKFRSLKPSLVSGWLTTSKDESYYYFSNFLRNSKLDELPQLINILIGDMNWVGPRANDPRIVKMYKDNDKREIFSVKPGLIDFSTLIFGIKSDDFIKDKDEENYFKTIEQRKIFYRKLYIKKKSFRTDIKILFLTAYSYLGFVRISEKNFNNYFK